MPLFGNKSEEPEKPVDTGVFDPDEDDMGLVLFKGAMNGNDADLAGNPKLVQVGLPRAKNTVSDALARRAEKLRIDPRDARSCQVTLFVDGVAFSGGRVSTQEAMAITQMLKLLAGLDINDRGSEQAGGINAEFNETKYELMVETAPVRGAGERLTVRIVNTLHRVDAPSEAGFPEDIKERIREVSGRKRGVMIVCGPPDSGVSTTAVATLRTIDAYLFNIINTADLGGREIIHIANFAGEPGDDLDTKLDRVIRKECDVVFVDPVNDEVACKTVFDQAERVFILGEMKASSGTAAIQQAITFTGDANLVADRIGATLCPKLIRKLCTECREAYRPNARLLQKVGLPTETRVLYRQPKEEDPETGQLRPVACLTCGGLGYYGRTVMLEYIEMTDELREAVARGATAAEMRSLAKKENMPTHRSEGMRLVVEGVTSLEELQRTFQNR